MAVGGEVVLAREVVGPDGLTDASDDGEAVEAIEDSDGLVEAFGGGAVVGPDGSVDVANNVVAIDGKSPSDTRSSDDDRVSSRSARICDLLPGAMWSSSRASPAVNPSG